MVQRHVAELGHPRVSAQRQDLDEQLRERRPMEVPNWQIVLWSGFTIPVSAMKSTRSSQACSIRRDE
jgi:hypothetical protein